MHLGKGVSKSKLRDTLKTARGQLSMQPKKKTSLQNVSIIADNYKTMQADMFSMNALLLPVIIEIVTNTKIVILNNEDFRFYLFINV